MKVIVAISDMQVPYHDKRAVKNLIEFVKDFDHIREGKGGYWEDKGYEWYAGIELLIYDLCLRIDIGYEIAACILCRPVLMVVDHLVSKYIMHHRMTRRYARQPPSEKVISIIGE